MRMLKWVGQVERMGKSTRLARYLPKIGCRMFKWLFKEILHVISFPNIWLKFIAQVLYEVI